MLTLTTVLDKPLQVVQIDPLEIVGLKDDDIELAILEQIDTEETQVHLLYDRAGFVVAAAIVTLDSAEASELFTQLRTKLLHS
jgi:hypothetical protein